MSVNNHGFLEIMEAYRVRNWQCHCDVVSDDSKSGGQGI
jgi:hypothetical protein